MEPKQQLGTVVLVITVTAAFLIVGAGGAFAQDSVELTITDIQADAPGDDHENLNDESVTFVIPRGDRTISEIENTSGINVSGYTISYGDGEVYELEANTVPIGTKFVVSSGSGRDLILERFPPIYDLHANFSQPVLNNEGDTVTIRNAEGEVLDQVSYGNEEPVGTTMPDDTDTEAETTTEETTPITDTGDGKAKQPSDGGNGKAKMGDGGGDDGDAKDGGNGKAKHTTTTDTTDTTTTTDTTSTTTTTDTTSTTTTTDTTSTTDTTPTMTTTDTTTIMTTTTTTVGNGVDAVTNGFSIVGVVAVLGILSAALLFRREP